LREWGAWNTLVGTIEAAEAVKVPPVGVGIVIEGGMIGARRGFVSREAREVKSGPF